MRVKARTASAACALVCYMLSIGTPRIAAQPAGPLASRTERELFERSLRAVRDHYRGDTVVAVVNLLPSTPEIDRWLVDAFVPADSATRHDREEVLAAMGIGRSADVSPQGCEASTRPGADRSRCPVKSIVKVALALSRAGGFYSLNPNLDERAKGLQFGWRTVRGVVMSLDASGSWAETIDLVFAPQDGQWKLVDFHVLLQSE